MISHFPLKDFKHNLWPKEWLGIWLAIWFLIIKTQEARVKWPLISVCNKMLEIFLWPQQLFPWEHFNWNSYCVGTMNPSLCYDELCECELFVACLCTILIWICITYPFSWFMQINKFTLNSNSSLLVHLSPILKLPHLVSLWELINTP